MLLRRGDTAVLVRPDGDVLGAVVGGELGAAQGEGRREERDARSRELLVPADSLERRSARAATAVPRMAASTLGFSNGKRACGSARRTVGRSANASARRIGPRRIGIFRRATGARCGLCPDATCSVPSSSRTAQPHAVGPWTSTPFWSAMPPSRTVSSGTLRPYRRPRAALPGAGRRPVHDRARVHRPRRVASPRAPTRT